MSRSCCFLLLSVFLAASCRSTPDDQTWAELERTLEAPVSASAAAEEPPAHPMIESALIVDEPLSETAVAAAILPPPYRRDLVIDEMKKLWIRDPDLLLDTIANARVEERNPPLAFLLAIAHAETNGRPLLVSEAGAVGLAQATPTAYLLEEQEGPLYVTRAYVDGMRAYVMKKPLGDAVAAVSAALGERRAPASQALSLIERARDLREIGVDEVRLLERWYDGSLEGALESDLRRNDAILDAAERMIRRGDHEAMRAFRDRTRDAYRQLMELQRQSWKRYYADLSERRDQLLLQEFGLVAKDMRGVIAYNAGEYLARVFDARFSPSQSAAFLVRHLDRKITEARALDESMADLTPLAAALYNGGAHNVLRMRAGLIESLQETERYAEKVPSTRMRLEAAMRADDRAGEAAGGGG